MSNLWYSDHEAKAAIRFIAQNNPACRDAAHAQEVLEHLLDLCRTLEVSRDVPVNAVSTLGFTVLRIHGSDRLAISVTPGMGEFSPIDWRTDGVALG